MALLQAGHKAKPLQCCLVSEGTALCCAVGMWLSAISSLLKIHESTALVKQRTEINALLLEGVGQELVSMSGSHLVCH